MAGEAVDSAELDDIAAEFDRVAAMFVADIKASKVAMAKTSRAAQDQVKLITEQSERIRRELAWQSEDATQYVIEADRRTAAVQQQVADARRLNEELARQLEAQRRSANQSLDAMAAREKELAAFQSQIEKFQAESSRRTAASLAAGAQKVRELLSGAPPSQENEISKKQFLQTRLRVAATGLFDGEFYLSRCPEVAAAGMDPLDHYALCVLFGTVEWRDPHPLFDSGLYLKQYPDVAAAKTDPLLHYVEFGAREGRMPNPLFDSRYYLERYPDVAAAGANPLYHYCTWGYKENRNPHPLFDAAYYLRRYPDVAKAKLNPLQHYLQSGLSQRRSSNPWFDVRWYLDHYSDVAAAGLDAMDHYLSRGCAEGATPGRSLTPPITLRNTRG